MIRRIALVGLLVGWVLAGGCYNVPQPVCGFFCGAAGECPADYTCSSADHRCHLNGSSATTCLTHDAGPIDMMDSIGVDVPDGNTAPTVTGTTPADQATGVSVIASISATFSEEVTGVSGTTFTLVQGATPVSGTVVYTTGAHLASFTPATQLAQNTTYTASVSSGITDLQGAPLVPKSWTFTTGTDATPPMVTMTTPAANATAVPVTSTVVAHFDEAVMGVSVSTFTLAAGATAISGTVTYNPGTRNATFTPASQLPGTTVLTATLTSGITDLAGNALSGAPVTWTFTTAADTTAPMVVTQTPAQGATGVGVTSTVTARFDEPVMGVSGTTFTVGVGATPIAGTVTYNAGTRTATYTPGTQLPASTLLTATLTSGITDTSSNALAGAPVTWTFTTGADTVAPSVQTTSPANNATMIATSSTISVTFDEPVTNVTTSTFTVNDGAAVTGTLASSGGGRTWTFTPTAALAAAATVTVTLTTAITDVAANALASQVTFSFMTQ